MGNSSSKSRLRGQLAAVEAALKKELDANRVQREDAISDAFQTRVQDEVAKARQEELEKQVSRLMQEIESSNTGKGEALAEVNHQRTLVQNLEEQLRAQRDEAAEHDRQTQETVTALQREVVDSKTSHEGNLTEAQRQVSILQQNNRDQIADLQSKVSRTGAELLTVQKDAKNLKLERDELIKARETLRVAMTNGKDKLKEANADRDESKAKLEDANADRDDLKAKLETEQENRRNMTAERDQLKEALDLEQAEKQQRQQQVQQQLQDVQGVRELLQRHEQQHQQLKQQKQQLEDRVASLTATLAAAPQANESRARPTASSSPQVRVWNYHQQPYTFSEPSIGKRDGYTQGIKFGEWDGEMRVDIRQYEYSRRSTKGVSFPVADAQRLAEILPEVVRQAEAERVRRRLY